MNVRLVIRRPCEVCDTTGEVLSEDWEAFEAWRERNPTGTPEDYFIGVASLDAVPAMNRECGNCQGGWVDGDMPFEDLVAEILSRLPTSVIEPGDLEKIIGDVRASITAAASRSRGLADADEAGSYLRTVQEGAAALRELTELLVRRDDL